MATDYDCVIVGSGPGGYETAIRATQLGMETAIVEKDKLGGVCLNVGCIPTKALLKSAEVMAETSHLDDFGLELDGSVSPDFPSVIERSRGAANQMNQGVRFLMQKNDIDVLRGHGRLTAPDTVEIEPSVNMDGEEVGEAHAVTGEHIILATGARPNELPFLPIDGEKVMSSKEAMLQTERPDSLVIVGAGAIGVEFGYFYHHMGTDVTIIEVQDRMVPAEDKDVSKELEKAYTKMGIEVMTGANVKGVDKDAEPLRVEVETGGSTGGSTEHIECDQVLSAVGVVGNVEDIGLETVGVETEGGDIVVDDYYRTNVDGV
ncbi:FAD-dependent oxidoreductase, partial [Salinibacter ruber]|uniref:FAD-dependent oxidoreductase n=1 Tax=Salinibacter ruber TaxID=146919 RepID=UPI0020738938